MSEDKRALLSGLLISLLFLLPFPRRVAHELLASTLLVPALRLEGALAEAKTLRAQRDSLVAENALMAQILGRRLLGAGPSALASPIRYDPPALPRRILLDRGTAGGVREGAPVLAGGALVGRVEWSTLSVSSVVTLFSPDLLAGVVFPRTGVLGILKGGNPPRVLYIPDWADVRPGDTALTSGLGGVFPRGLPVGVVEGVGERGGYLEVFIEPLYRPQLLTRYAVLP